MKWIHFELTLLMSHWNNNEDECSKSFDNVWTVKEMVLKDDTNRH